MKKNYLLYQLNKKMKNLLISIDIFGYPPSFSILKQPFHLTVFGGILSVILIIIGFITLIFFFPAII